MGKSQCHQPGEQEKKIRNLEQEPENKATSKNNLHFHHPPMERSSLLQTECEAHKSPNKYPSKALIIPISQMQELQLRDSHKTKIQAPGDTCPNKLHRRLFAIPKGEQPSSKGRSPQPLFVVLRILHCSRSALNQAVDVPWKGQAPKTQGW